ncbi:ABC transporter permease [Nocardioides albidus]|uniref:ABC transporter permease n=1 Tax=Nocardioides albidus TaxID=1517589 RepID=A0A5C4VT87_9ACTN|nr:ABC transporter permease [Nocardioides albidus]TNM38479.1 ABC transporter permease [Nocardioides albidus]
MVNQIRTALSRFGTVIALVLLVAYFQVNASSFLTSGNIAAVLSQAAVLVLLAGGLTLVLVLGQFDLSVGWVATLAGMVCTGLMSEHGVSLALAIAAALGSGALVGLVNGLLVTRLQVNALLATLATSSIIQGLLVWYSITPFSTGLSPKFLDFGFKAWGPLPAPALAAGVVTFVVWVILQHTAAGRHMYAVGGSPEAARVAGIDVKRITVGAFVACSTMAAAGGVVLAGQLGSGQPQGAVGLLLGTFAAAFLGSATWREGEFHIAGTVIGVLILGVVFSGLGIMNTPAYLNNIVTGGILIAAVGMASLLRPRS